MTRHAVLLRLTCLGALALGVSAPIARAQDSGCRTGAVPAVVVFIYSNPGYSYFLGRFEDAVARLAPHLRAGSPAIRCLSSLSSRLLVASLVLYDPQEQQRHDEINSRMEEIGGSRLPPQASASGDLLSISLRFARLARAMPAAAAGDYGPWMTPTTELEQMQILAEQLLGPILSAPEGREVIRQLEPLLREMALLQQAVLLRQAFALAEADCAALPNDPECAFVAGARALQAGDVAGARAAFLRARGAAPDNADFATAEAVQWYRAGRLAEAEQANRRALQLDPNNFTATDNLAFVLFDLRRNAEALAFWEKALTIRPDDPDALAGRAIALQALQRPAEALQSYRRAVSINAEYRDCVVMREKFIWSTTACQAAAPLIAQIP